MKSAKTIKTILCSLVYGIHFILAAALWLSGMSGNILVGILLIILYRLSLWSAPLVVTVLCWLPWKPKESVREKLLFYAVQLLFCGLLFVVCYLLFGNWY